MTERNISNNAALTALNRLAMACDPCNETMELIRTIRAELQNGYVIQKGRQLYFEAKNVLETYEASLKISGIDAEKEPPYGKNQKLRAALKEFEIAAGVK